MTSVRNTSNMGTLGQSTSNVISKSIIQLQELSKRVQRNNEKLDDATINTWKSSLVNLTDNYVTVNKRIELLKQVLVSENIKNLCDKLDQSENNKPSSSSSSSANVVDIKGIIESINQQVDSTISKVNLKEEPIALKVREILKLSTGKKRKNDDIEIVEHEDDENENTFKCPILLKMMNEPMQR